MFLLLVIVYLASRFLVLLSFSFGHVIDYGFDHWAYCDRSQLFFSLNYWKSCQFEFQVRSSLSFHLGLLLAVDGSWKRGSLLSKESVTCKFVILY